MKKYLLPSLKLTAVFIVICAVVYPLFIAAVAKLAPGGGKGETLLVNGKVVGYANIGQKFTDDKYFWGRPSAAAYNAGPGAIMKLCNCFGSMKSAAAAYDTDSGAIIKDVHSSSLRETKPYVKSVVGAWNRMNEYHKRKQE